MENSQLNELLTKLIEKSKSEIKILKGLKNTSVQAQMYELAAELRDIELKFFPKTEEQLKAEQLASNVSVLLRMADMNAAEKECYILFSLFELYKKKRGKVDMHSVINLTEKANKLFQS